jgi:nucleoside-diphosphate-sugar epimerase
MKILVTGAAGFIGSHAAKKLATLSHDVIGVDNLSEYYSKELKLLNVDSIKKSGAAFIQADLRYIQYNKLPKDIDYIFHFAAQPGLSQTAKFEDYLLNNVIATQRLIEFAKQCKQLRMFINISTSSVYGADATKDETAAPAPVSFYGVTKLAAEQLILAETRNHIFNACSLRLYSVYGPGERPDKLYTKLIQAALCDAPFTLVEGSLKHKRSFTFVADVVDAIVKVIGNESILSGEIINIGSNVQYTTKEGIETVENLTNKKIQFKIIPPRPGDQSTTKAVIDKAKRLLNYQPQTSLREGIRQQIEWFEHTNLFANHKHAD